MKLQKAFRILPLLAVLAGTAAAQSVAFLPVGPSPYAGAPAYLPGPAGGGVVVRIELPSPRLNPGLAVSLTPAPAIAIAAVFPALPIPMIPSRPIVPVIRPVASRENVAHPLASILPGLRAELGVAEEKNGRRKEIGDNLFDGRAIPERKTAVDPAPVRPSRSVTFPEADLEREIGAY